MNKAAFLDRDGTINVDKNYLYKIEDFEFLPGAIDGLKKLQDAGYLLIIITNQSGIARGYYTEDDYQKINDYMIKQLKDRDIIITDVLFCPHHPYAAIKKYRKNCNCRKPQLGLFELSMKKWNIDCKESIAIGDNLRDLKVCEIYGCRGYLIQQNGIQKVLKKYGNIQVIHNISEVPIRKGDIIH